ncbi:MAG: helix-turn-helix transcriptional regulator [Bacteroidales bacterium]
MKKARNYTSKLIDDLLDEISPKEQEITDKRMLLAAKIDEAIKAKGWNKQNFAEAIDKYPSEISKWLSGTHNFNSDTLFEIERVLGIKLINLPETVNEQVFVFKINVTSGTKISVPNCLSDYSGAIPAIKWTQKPSREIKNDSKEPIIQYA